jgi:hypothetical protein
MRYFRLFLAGILFLLLMPPEVVSQTPSRSRLPSGERPLMPSRRTLFYNQANWEVGAGGGVAYSLTDAGGMSIDKKASFLNTQWNTADMATGIFARYRFNRIFAVNTTFHYARLNGADSIAGRSRGFYFNNQIAELAVRYEMFFPFPLAATPFDAYGFLGMAAFYNNPALYVPDPAPSDFTWDEYSLIQPAIPMGFGFNYYYNNLLKIGYEIGWRKTFFDYLDGFTRPWSKGYDSYYFNTIKVTYIFPGKRSPW